MKRWQVRPWHLIVAAMGAFLIAAASFSGFVFGDKMTIRFIAGAVGMAVGIGCLSRYERARLMARARETNDLRDSLLAQAREAAAQQERNRLARDLHDSIKQQLFSINVSAAAAQARWDGDPEGARKVLADVRRSAQSSLVEMNALLQQLSPAPLEKVGLMQALRDQCEALGYRSGAEVAAELGELPTDDRLPPGAQESLFRIVQEALSNVTRHARASHVRLYVGQRDAEGPLVLEIQDDGQGFEAAQVHTGMGLVNIRQRVVGLGGQLTIESAPGQGTRVAATIPLAEPVEQAEAADGQKHVLTRSMLVGLGGGLALIAASLYPLYVLVPGRYVGGWPGGSRLVGLALGIVAALLAVTLGFLAARWARASTRLACIWLGALAGGVAGAVLYFGLGASAADVIGGRALLARGLVAAADRADAIRLLAGALVEMVWWSHGAFWAALLAGTGLGALGGLLVPPAVRLAERFRLRQQAGVILTAIVLASAASFLAVMTRFAPLEPTLRTALDAHGVSLETTFPLEGVSDWLVGTPLALYLASLCALNLLLRAEIRETEDPVALGVVRAAAALLGLVSFAVPVYAGMVRSLAWQGAASLPPGLMDVLGLDHPVAVPSLAAAGALPLVSGLVASLLLGGLYLVAFTAARRRQRALDLAAPRPKAVLQLAIARWMDAGLGSVIAIAIPPMTVISMAVSLSMISTKLIEVLAGSAFAREEFTLVELVRDVYGNQASAFLTTFMAAAVAVGLLTLVISGFMSIVEQFLEDQRGRNPTGAG